MDSTAQQTTISEITFFRRVDDMIDVFRYRNQYSAPAALLDHCCFGFFFFKLGRVLHLLIKTFAYISSAES